MAQLGVQLLLFTLGLEFSMSKLRAVRNVALLGGLLQTALFAVLAAVGAKLIGTSAAQVSGEREACAGSSCTVAAIASRLGCGAGRQAAGGAAICLPVVRQGACIQNCCLM